MFFVAMFPRAWFSMMDPKVVAWADADMNKVNLDPDLRDELFSRYHHAESV